MAVALRGTPAANDTGTGSSLTVTATMPAAAQAGDKALVVVCAERGLIPVVTGGVATWATLQSDVNSTNMASVIAWADLAAGDLGQTITATVGTGRRMAIGIVVFSGAKTGAPQIVTNAYVGSSGGDPTAECPAITPTDNDSMLVSVANIISVFSPFIRTFTSTGGWTEDVDETSNHASAANAVVYIAHKLLSGGAGVSAGGNVVTSADPQMNYWTSTLALAPAGTAATPTPATVAAAATIPAPARTMTEVAVTVAAVASVAAPTVTTVTHATPTPVRVAATATVPRPGLNARALPASVAGVGTVGAPTVTTVATLMTNSAEGGATAGDGTTVTIANSGGASGHAFGLNPGGTVTFDNAVATHGSWSYRVVAGAGQTGILAIQGFSNTRVVARKYIILDEYPTSGTDLIQIRASAAAAKINIAPNGRLLAQTGGGTDVGVQSSPLPLLTPIRVELRAEAGTSTGNGTIAAAYYIGDSFTPVWSQSSSLTNAGTAPFIEVRFGKPNPAGDLTANVDGIAVDYGTSTFIGPIVASPTPATVAAATTVPTPSISGSSVNGRVALIQGWNPTSSGSAAVTSQPGTFLATPTSGNTLFAAVVSDNTVNTPAGWTLAAPPVVGAAATYLFYKTAGGAESTTVTITPTAPSAVAVAVAEYDGPTTVDSYASSASAGTALNTGTATLSHPADLAIAVFGSAGTAPAGIGNPSGGFVEQVDRSTNRASGTDVNLSVGTLRTSTSGGYAASATAAGTVTGGGGLLVGFRLDLTDSQPRPSSVAVVASVPAPAVVAQLDQTVTPVAVAATASAGPVVIDTPGRTQVNPTTVAATATIATIVSVTAHSTVTPTVVKATATVPAPETVGSGVALVVVLPAVVAAAAAIPAPTVVRGSAMNVATSTVAASASVPAPGITLGVATTVTPATVDARAAVDSPTITAPDVGFEVSTVSATASIPGVVVVVSESRYIFRSPVISERAVDSSGRALWWKVEHGITLLKIDGTFREVRYPTDEEIAQASVVYRGGYESEITLAEFEDLELAGYGSNVSTIS